MGKNCRQAVIIVVLLSFVLFVPKALACDRYTLGSQPYLSGDAAILMDAKTGQVLYAKNPFKKRPPASTTKVMTALLAIETGRLNDTVTISPKAARTEGSSMYLSTGEVFTMSDLLYGALLKSGNDACVAIAEHIAGSVEGFAVLMNIKALAIGALNTNFVNPHGLPDENHYTCAYDLALIARRALANRTFSDIVSTKDRLIDLPGNGWDRRLENTNQLLWRYLWADGVKTGTTNAAGQCLVSSASKGSRQLVAVVLRSGDRWTDSITMFEYGFNHYEYSQVAVAGAGVGNYKVLDGVEEYMPVAYGADLGVLVPVQNPKALTKRVSIQPDITAPVKKGQVIGEASYFANGCFAGKVNLVSAADIERQGLWHRLKKWVKTRTQNIFG
ncbi:MAG: D-alanyl-D-alanine carboxypeptidase [Firmicutes bacterium]|nr:D-alanyl-D-alanine carboxypeptidase [Bacillota bacterium]